MPADFAPIPEGAPPAPTEQLFRAVVESSPNGIVMVDRRGVMVLVNRETERLFGYPREELIGQSIEMLVPKRFRDPHPAYRAGFVDAPQRRAMGAGRDLFGVHRNGAEFAVEIGLNPIETEGGLFVLASVVDISQRKQAEAELRRSNEELERFAYVASHDLQEPLRTVASYVQLLERRYRGQLDDDAREFIDFAVGGVSRMQHLIHDLLAFSRVGTRGGNLVELDTADALAEALGSLRAAIEESGAEITHDPMPIVVGDPGQLTQVLTNLLGNALKFRSNRQPAVHVSVKRDGRFWHFGVSDNGIGIDPAYFDRIFVIFQRLHARDEYQGTGVGLAICKKIIERHGGTIWVESDPEVGSTFHFTLAAVAE